MERNSKNGGLFLSLTGYAGVEVGFKVVVDASSIDSEWCSALPSRWFTLS